MIQPSSVGATRIRAYDPADEREVRRICFRSALYGKPIERLINDPRLVTEALVSDIPEKDKMPPMPPGGGGMGEY